MKEFLYDTLTAIRDEPFVPTWLTNIIDDLRYSNYFRPFWEWGEDDEI